MLKIAVVVGSVRPGRKGRTVADWVVAQSGGREGADYEIVDLADHPLPLLNEPLPPRMGRHEHEHTKRWAAAVAPYDGYVFVTPEYNHGMPASLKNALDYLYAEWVDKATAIVGYGYLGAGRSVEQLRSVLSSLQMAHVSPALHFSLIHDWHNQGADFRPGEHHYGAAVQMFDQVEAWAGALKTLRG
ncbi:MAG: NAD(P)H-dependent oxidoreductase [Promicromonosporaceae bacterium]|nr:NAD(P)H-dependent oxidoreductase [Promicromonosporaceae bacterium]